MRPLTKEQSGTGSNGNEEVLHTFQISRNEASVSNTYSGTPPFLVEVMVVVGSYSTVGVF